MREQTENDPLCSGEPELLIKSLLWYLGLKSAGNSYIIANYGAAIKKLLCGKMDHMTAPFVGVLLKSRQ